MWNYIHSLGRGSERTPDKATTLLKISHDLAVVRIKPIENPDAIELLKAFNLTVLLDDELPITFAEKIVEFTPERQVDENLANIVGDIVRGWRILQGCIKPIQTLLIPNSVLEEKNFDDTLTIDLRYSEGTYPQARSLAHVLENITTLYEVVSVASGYEEFSPLVVVYADSGSDLRFDFRVLKGLGEPIRQLKALFVEVWSAIRFRKAEDFKSNGKAIIEGLEILDKIEAKRRKKVLTTEEANRLKLRLNRAMFGLFESGALPREIPSIETFSNDELMHGFQQKLLPPPSVVVDGNKRSAKRARPTKKVKNLKKKKENDSHDNE